MNTRIYFIRSARSKAVKIGVTNDVQSRLIALQTGSAARLVIVAEMPGDSKYERELHRAFAEYRIRGEWFRLEGRLAAFIEALPVTARTRSPEALAARDHWRIGVLPLLRDAVLFVGVDRFAEAAGAYRPHVVKAIYDRGQHFPQKWWHVLAPMLPLEMRLSIANEMVNPFGFRAIDPRTR